MSKVCIVGAGAIGGFIGTRLAAAGRLQVSALARGDTLTALQKHGWRLQSAAELVQAPARVSDKATDLGVQDVVIIAVKGPALTQAVRSIAPLIGPDTIIMPAMNGVPWWFCQTVAGFPEGPLESVDPGGHIAATIPVSQVVGCVVHASTSMLEPGLVQHKMGQGLIVGEACGGASARAQELVDSLIDAGFDATASSNVRYDIWYKLWGNMTMNPVSAMTGATGDRILADPQVRSFCSAVMAEAQDIGARIGCPIAQTAEDRHNITAKLGAFKTSMLQDVEAGRPVELDALVGVVREIGQKLGIATPQIDTLYGLSRLFAQVHGLYPDSAS
jgi:2-dehydropantoate 2-reductase